MAPEIRKTAEAFVKQQVRLFDGKVPQRDVQQAIRKVANALEEVRTARAAVEGQGLSLK